MNVGDTVELTNDFQTKFQTVIKKGTLLHIHKIKQDTVVVKECPTYDIPILMLSAPTKRIKLYSKKRK